jgi:hypothetical protein
MLKYNGLCGILAFFGLLEIVNLENLFATTLSKIKTTQEGTQTQNSMKTPVNCEQINSAPEEESSENTQADLLIFLVTHFLLTEDFSEALRLTPFSKGNHYPLTPNETNRALRSLPFSPLTAKREDIPRLKRWLSRFSFNENTDLTFDFHKSLPDSSFLKTLLYSLPKKKRRLLQLEYFDKKHFSKNVNIMKNIAKIKKNTQSDTLIIVSSISKKTTKKNDGKAKSYFSRSSLLLKRTIKIMKRQATNLPKVVVLLHSFDPQKPDILSPKTGKIHHPFIFDSVFESSEKLFYFLKKIARLGLKNFTLLAPNYDPIEIFISNQKKPCSIYTPCIEYNKKGEVTIPNNKPVHSMFDELLFTTSRTPIALGVSRLLSNATLPITELFLINPNKF